MENLTLFAGSINHVQNASCFLAAFFWALSVTGLTFKVFKRVGVGLILSIVGGGLFILLTSLLDGAPSYCILFLEDVSYKSAFVLRLWAGALGSLFGVVFAYTRIRAEQKKLAGNVSPPVGDISNKEDVL